MPTQERARPPPVQSPRNPLPQGSDELQKNLRRKTKMKNYQSLYYKNYFAQNADGDYAQEGTLAHSVGEAKLICLVSVRHKCHI